MHLTCCYPHFWDVSEEAWSKAAASTGLGKDLGSKDWQQLVVFAFHLLLACVGARAKQGICIQACWEAGISKQTWLCFDLKGSPVSIRQPFN